MNETEKNLMKAFDEFMSLPKPEREKRLYIAAANARGRVWASHINIQRYHQTNNCNMIEFDLIDKFAVILAKF